MHHLSKKPYGTDRMRGFGGRRRRWVGLAALALALSGCGSSSSSSSPSSSPTSAPAQNHVHAIVILPSDPEALYLGAHYSLEKSTDGGKTWHPLVKQMMLSMVLDPRHPSTLYGVSLQRGLEKSTDSGKSWSSTAAGIAKAQVTGVTIDPASGTLLAYGVGIYRSVNGGAHWARTLKGLSVGSAAVGSGGSAYAATGTGLQVSHDGGIHWSSVSTIGNQPIVQVAASGAVAYAVSPISLYKTSDGGRSWKTLSRAPAGIEFLGVAPSNPNEVFAEVAGQGFRVSHDGGATWHAADSGIHDRNFNASTVRVAPSSPQIAYTGAWGLNFYATRDGGRHWTKTATLTH